MRDDCLEVDGLLLQLSDYKNDVADMAAEKLLRKCSTNWGAYRYLQDRLHDAWLPESARQQVGQIIKKYRCSCINGKSAARRMNQFKTLPLEKRPGLSLISPTEKTEHAKSRACSC
jgi:hypothetical protein